MLSKAATIGCIVLLLACIGAPAASFADEDLITFAESTYAETETTFHDARCAVCGSPLFRSRQLVEVLDGRYRFADVDQSYCPVCNVTTLSMEGTPRATWFFRLLSWRLPAARDKVVYRDNRYALAFKSSATLPFISNIFGLRTQDGKVYFEVE